MARTTAAVFVIALGCRPVSADVHPTTGPAEADVIEELATPCAIVAALPVVPESVAHADWLALWADLALAPEAAEPPASAADARRLACTFVQRHVGATPEPPGDSPDGCSGPGPWVLAVPHGDELVIFVVASVDQELRSLSLSRWSQVCRCTCGSEVEVLPGDPLAVVVREHEAYATLVHGEGDEIVEGCAPDDSGCMTACMGDGYGSQRLLVIDDSLTVGMGFIDETTVSPDRGEFGVAFKTQRDQLIALGECTQVLAER